MCVKTPPLRHSHHRPGSLLTVEERAKRKRERRSYPAHPSLLLSFLGNQISALACPSARPPESQSRLSVPGASLQASPRWVVVVSWEGGVCCCIITGRRHVGVRSASRGRHSARRLPGGLFPLFLQAHPEAVKVGLRSARQQQRRRGCHGIIPEDFWWRQDEEGVKVSGRLQKRNSGSALALAQRLNRLERDNPILGLCYEAQWWGGWDVYV